MSGLVNSFVFGAGGGGGGTLTFVASAVSNDNANITIPASAQEGDFAVLIEYNGENGDVEHAFGDDGFTAIVNKISNRQVFAGYKVLESGDSGAVIAGRNGSFANNKCILVFRPDFAIAVVTPSTWNLEVTNFSPSDQTVLAAAGTAPLIVIGAIAETASTVSFQTASPAFDAEVTTADGDMRLGYKIYDSSPADHTIGSVDHGTGNALLSGYIELA